MLMFIFALCAWIDRRLVTEPAPAAVFAFSPAPTVAVRIGARVDHAAFLSAVFALLRIGELHHQSLLADGAFAFSGLNSSSTLIRVPSGSVMNGMR